MTDPKTECQDLMNALLPVAEEMLTKHREFYPFGGTMLADGQIAHTAGWTGDEHPPSAEIIQLLQDAFRDGAANGEYRATALLYDVRVTPPDRQQKQDAIAVALDHRDQYSRLVLFTYAFADDGQLEIDSPFATEGQNSVFTQ